LPALIVFSSDDVGLDILFILGAVIATGGLILESIADQQKFVFKNTYPHRFMNSGVWKNLRHPNYTGEILFWLGLSTTTLGLNNGYWAILSPLWISFILIKFSGIPILKKTVEEKYGADPEYQKYVDGSWYLFPYIY